MSERAQAIIDTTALRHNLAKVKEFAPHSRVLAMVKGNAYGHGLVEIGHYLQEADAFGVACLEEAIKLRAGGILTPIVIMSGIFTADDLDQVVLHGLQIVVHEPFQIRLLSTAKTSAPVTVWLKIDTGMHRLGIPASAFKAAYTALANCPAVKSLVLMTHLADGDNPNKSSAANQIHLFHALVKNLSCPKSIANSAGVLAWPDAVLDWNRPGIMLYGISPLLGKLGEDHGLRPVMTLKSKLIAIHDFIQGDAIGYDGTWSCPEDMRAGVVAIGYGDGYPRHAKTGTPVLIQGKACPIVGRVSMDLITVDLRPCSEACIGDDVILWGNGLPAETVATYADTIAYELTCNVSQRVVYVYR